MKAIKEIYNPGSKHWVGDGFPVRNLFPSHEIFKEVSPYLLLDYAGPRYFEPSDRPHGVGEHPHRGFETVTVLYQGEVEHRDSAGNSGKLGPGDVQWMTAASGVVHEEMHGREFAKRGGNFEAVQLWVNLPRDHKMDKPRYQDIPHDRIPEVKPTHGVLLRVIAGKFAGTKGPAETVTPVFLWDIRMEEGSKVELPFPTGQNASLFLLTGDVEVNGEKDLTEAELAVLDPEGETVTLEAKKSSKLLALGGEPIREPVVQRGPFVMNTWQEIAQAADDYQSGRMGHLD
jgi:redox-sensitive bicupin YhaK (pirin superfamily)